MQECIKRIVSTETKFRFHVFQDERFVDLNLYQYGWEQTEPLHSYGPYARNHYLFHYVISGKGLLLANGQEYAIEGGHGFLITPGEVTTYRADEQDPWEYTWIEFDGLRAHEALNLAGMSVKYTTPAQHKSNLRNVYGTFAIEGMTISKDTRSNLDRIGNGQASYQQVVNELRAKYAKKG